MSGRAARLIVASGLALWVATGVEAQTVVTPLFPGITHIKRTEQYPPFQCPGCPAPTPNPRLARINILLIDLTSPAIRFKLTPPGDNLPAVAPGSTTPNWPVVPFEVVRQRTLTSSTARTRSRRSTSTSSRRFRCPADQPRAHTRT